MDTKIGTGQSGGYDQPIPSFEEFKEEYAHKIQADMARGVHSEAQLLDIELLQDVYLEYYRLQVIMKEADEEHLSADEFLEKCAWIQKAQKENRVHMQAAKENGNSAEVEKLHSVHNFYQTLANDAYAMQFKLEDRDIQRTRKS